VLRDGTEIDFPLSLFAKTVNGITDGIVTVLIHLSLYKNHYTQSHVVIQCLITDEHSALNEIVKA